MDFKTFAATLGPWDQHKGFLTGHVGPMGPANIRDSAKPLAHNQLN